MADDTILWGLVFGLMMAGTLNLGKALQKQGIQLFEREKIAGNTRAKKGVIWIVGISFSAIQPAFQIVAQAIIGAPATVYSAMMGLGIVVVMIYARKVLKEQIGRFEVLGAVAIIGGTTLFGIASIFWERPDSAVNWVTFGVSMVILGALFVVAIAFTTRTKRLWGVVWGIVAGSLGGLDNVFKSMSGRNSSVQGSVDLGAFGAFANVFFYISFAAGIGALLLTNVGYIRGKAVTVVPAYTTFYVLIPLLLEALFYGVSPTAFQVIGVGIAIAGVVLSTAFRQEKATSPGEALQAPGAA